MNKLIEMYQELYDNDVIMLPHDCPFSDSEAKSAVIKVDGDYGFFLDPSRIETLAEEKVIVAVARGYIITGATHNVSGSLEVRGKNAHRANVRAFEKLLPYEALCDCFRRGIIEPWDVAEEMTLPVKFATEAMKYYQEQAMGDPHFYSAEQ